MSDDRLTDEGALKWVIEQLQAHVRLRIEDRGSPGVVIEGPNREMIVVTAYVAPHLMISGLER